MVGPKGQPHGARVKLEASRVVMLPCSPIPTHPLAVRVPVVAAFARGSGRRVSRTAEGWQCLCWGASLPRAASPLSAPCWSQVKKEPAHQEERGGLSSLGVPVGSAAGRSRELKSSLPARAGFPSHSPISSWGLPKLLGTVCLSAFPF